MAEAAAVRERMTVARAALVAAMLGAGAHGALAAPARAAVPARTAVPGPSPANPPRSEGAAAEGTGSSTSPPATPPGAAAPPAPKPPAASQPPAAEKPPEKPAPSVAIKRVSAEAMAEILRDAGFRAQIVTSGSKPYIRTGMAGRRATVNFYDCKAEGCQSVQFRVVYTKNKKFTLAFANAWNLKKRFAKAYVDGDGDLNFEWDVDLDGGVSSAYLTQAVLSFSDLIGLFDGFDAGTTAP